MGFNPDPPVNGLEPELLIASTSTVYVPGGSPLMSYTPINDGSWEPEAVAGLFGSQSWLAAGSTLVGMPTHPVKVSPETLETATTLPSVTLRAMTLKPCAGVTPSEKNT